MRVFNFLLVILVDLILFFWCEGGVALLLSMLSVFCFTILKFWSFQFFFLSFCGFSKKIVWSFARGERGEYSPFFLWTSKVFCFHILKFRSFQFFFLSFWGLKFFFFGVRKGGVGGFVLVDFESFLFYYFEVLKLSIFILVILWVFKKKLCEVLQGERGGICLSSREFWKFFVFVFWSFGIFNFLFVILGVFKFVLCEVSQVRKLGMCLSSCEIWKLFVFVVWNFRILNFLLSFWGSLIFLCEVS